MKRLSTYFNQVMQELKKVTWPSRQETINMTILVIAISAIVALYIGSLDLAAQKLISWIIN